MAKFHSGWVHSPRHHRSGGESVACSGRRGDTGFWQGQRLLGVPLLSVHNHFAVLPVDELIEIDSVPTTAINEMKAIPPTSPQCLQLPQCLKWEKWLPKWYVVAMTPGSKSLELPISMQTTDTVTTFPFHIVTHACMHRPAMATHANSPCSQILIWHITFTTIQPHTCAHLLCVPQHLHSFIHFCMYSDLILTFLHDHWLMPNHLKTPTKSSLDLQLMPNRLIHSHVYSSHLDLTAHDLQLMPDHLKTLSHLSLISYLFLLTHDDSSQDAFLFIFWLISIHLTIHLSTHADSSLDSFRSSIDSSLNSLRSMSILRMVLTCISPWLLTHSESMLFIVYFWCDSLLCTPTLCILFHIHLYSFWLILIHINDS